jgi:hypothetical protein
VLNFPQWLNITGYKSRHKPALIGKLQNKPTSTNKHRSIINIKGSCGFISIISSNWSCKIGFGSKTEGISSLFRNISRKNHPSA